MIGFVDNDAYNGVIGKKPFNFKHNNINFIALYKDGEQIPSRPLQPDFAGRRSIRSFLSLYTETRQYYLDEGIDFTKDDFKGGNVLFAFDLRPDLESCGENFELVNNGNLRLEVHFAQALPATVNTVIYAEFDNLLQIDKSRNVVFDYNA